MNNNKERASVRVLICQDLGENEVWVQGEKLNLNFIFFRETEEVAFLGDALGNSFLPELNHLFG